MESKNEDTYSRSLPPLVEGKVHGYLNLVIDEIVWLRRSPGDVTVLASWWGELDSAQFRPADVKNGANRPQVEISETYAIRTNLDLFEEYLKNCETLELVVISEKNHQVVGTAQVAELSNILNGKSYFQYVPILNDNGSRTGDVHVRIKLSIVERISKSPVKKSSDKASQKNTNFIETSRNFNHETRRTSYTYENDVPLAIKNAKQNENVYRSILKERCLDSEHPGFKSFTGVNDKLVAQVVARAQRLRGAILKETREEDPLALSESSTMDSFRSDLSANKEANLYEYFLGTKMSHSEEKKALAALRTISPTPSLIDLAAETIKSCRNEKNFQIYPEAKIPSAAHCSKAIDDISIPESLVLPARETAPIDYVDSLRIAVESLTLSSAGYRRVRSSCLSRGDGIPLSVTYFVQYDAIFGNTKKLNRKIIDESKPVKLCSKKQVGQVIYFNHEAVYDLPKSYLQTDVPLNFKIFNRHLNQRTPTELGIGSMHIADAARVRSLSSTQRLAIVNKGIKIGELKVTAELGCDKIHFGKQFVEAVTSAKENIPVLEVSSESTLETPRYRKAVGSESKEKAKSSSSSANKPEISWSVHNTARTERDETRQHRVPRDEERVAQQEDPSRDIDERILLHGLIYIAEGKNLSFLSTYLICRAFWRGDRAASRICNETSNPLYNFHQLVPLIHGQDLLERTRNNFIVIEVYARKATGMDELLGISKLSVHPLYLAFKDPEVLPHLLSSKYPVISVDEWVPVAHPVSGLPCGQIRALVALGTADQIALLEMTRGLRDSRTNFRNVDNPSRHTGEYSRSTGNPVNTGYSQNYATPGYEDYVNTENTEDRSVKNISCQTEITTVQYFKRNNIEEELARENPQSNVLNVIVDRLAQALNVPKNHVDQAAQTETETRQRNSSETSKIHEIEPLNLNPSTNNSFSVDSASNSDVDSQRGNFFPSREIYRSVGVGAEIDDPVNFGPSTSYAPTNTAPISNGFEDRQSATNSPRSKNENSNPGLRNGISENTANMTLTRSQDVANERLDCDRSDNENSSFRAVVEIECALHLPRVEKYDETVEPCTYVTFQKARNHDEHHYGCYVVTNLYPFSCSPKWDWRCDTNLSNDLLDNEEKRLILKVWRLVDPESSMEINLERDIVIGFAAIDVSVLTVGFPVVSGWFHVMDFTGKCNGQIKVSVTPLDNVAGLGKITCQSHAARSAQPDFYHSNFATPYYTDTRNNGAVSNSGCTNLQETSTHRNQMDHEPTLDIGLNLGDASMSFLSLSLKQKLSELDEIKKRLQSRLHDVTNAAFDDDFDNDFDTPIAEDENDDGNNGNTEDSRNVLRKMENWQIPREHAHKSNSVQRATMTNDNDQSHFGSSENQRVPSNSTSIEANYTDTGYSTSSNVPSCRNVSNGYSGHDDNRFHSQHSSDENMVNGYAAHSTYSNNEDFTNGHYTIEPTNLRNRTDVLNVRNYHSNDSEIANFRGSSEISENIGNDDLTNERSEDYPIRGTRMHISHLLDKLTTQLTAVPPPSTNQPMKRNIMDLITSLRRNNNNFSSDTKCNREINVRTVPTQTETNYAHETPLTQTSNNSTESRENLISNERNRGSEDGEIPGKSLQRNQKVSTAIREELAAEEANDSLDCDELSTHLMTTNVRHIDLQSMMNPLLYPHLIPDVRTTNNGTTSNLQISSNNSGTPEVEAIERMETRYAENFNATINNGLSRLRNLMETENTSRCAPCVPENEEIFRMTPSGISENIDGNIDVTVIHKPCNDDLMASNSVDSTTTISLENDLQISTEMDDNSSLNSTHTSVSGVSRQAPDGGNPVEESSVTAIAKPQDDSQDSSLAS